MKKRKRLSEDYKIFFRYFILFLVGIPNLWLFSFIFTPLTIYAVYSLLGLFFNVSLVSNLILISGQFPIELIDACIAGPAYYLLFMFNLSIPKIKFGKRLKIILFSFLSLFVLNVLRIFLLSFVVVKELPWFDFAHIFFWYMGSVVFVVGIWFAAVKIFKIKEIPFYSDLKFIIHRIKKLRKDFNKSKKSK